MALQKSIRIHQFLDDRLVWARSHQTCLQHTQTLSLVALCQDLGGLVNMEKSELYPKQVFNLNFRRLPVQPERGHGQTQPGPVADTDKQNQRIINRTGLSSPVTHVPDRAVDSNRKTGSPRSTAYEIHLVAPQTKTGGFQNH